VQIWDSMQGQNMVFVSRTGWGAMGVAAVAALAAMAATPAPKSA